MTCSFRANRATVRKHRITFSTRPDDRSTMNVARNLILCALLELDDEHSNGHACLVMLTLAADMLTNLNNQSVGDA
jgi:hypothetical protein